MNYYLQTQRKNWLPTPEGTVWIEENPPFIQPEDVSLRTTPLGVDLNLLDDKDLTLFKPIKTIKIISERSAIEP